MKKILRYIIILSSIFIFNKAIGISIGEIKDLSGGKYDDPIYGIKEYISFAPYNEIIDTPFDIVFTYKDINLSKFQGRELGIFKVLGDYFIYQGGENNKTKKEVSLKIKETGTYVLAPIIPQGDISFEEFKYETIKGKSIKIKTNKLYYNNGTIVNDNEKYIIKVNSGTIINGKYDPYFSGYILNPKGGILNIEYKSDYIGFDNISIYNEFGKSYGTVFIKITDNTKILPPTLDTIKPLNNNKYLISWKNNSDNIKNNYIYFRKKGSLKWNGYIKGYKSPIITGNNSYILNFDPNINNTLEFSIISENILGDKSDFSNIKELKGNIEIKSQYSQKIKKRSEIKVKDISSHWSSKYVYKLIIYGIVNNQEKFFPEKNITRAEFIKMLINSANIDVSGYTSDKESFKDVKKDDWFYKYIEYAVDTGIISKGQFFRPSENITRAETMKMITKITNIDIIDGLANPFNDVKDSDVLTKYILNSYKNGIVSGDNKNGKLLFYPDKFLSRAEAAKILVNTFDIY